MKIVVTVGAGYVMSNDSEHYSRKPFVVMGIDNFYKGKLLLLVKSREIIVFTNGIFDKIMFHSLFKAEIVY